MTTETTGLGPSQGSLTTEQMQRIARAKSRLQAAKLRISACQSDQQAAGYARQATHPIYDGQSEICAGKGAHVAAIGNQLRAQADLIEAEAGL